MCIVLCDLQKYASIVARHMKQLENLIEADEADKQQPLEASSPSVTSSPSATSLPRACRHPNRHASDWKFVGFYFCYYHDHDHNYYEYSSSNFYYYQLPPLGISLAEIAFLIATGVTSTVRHY